MYLMGAAVSDCSHHLAEQAETGKISKTMTRTFAIKKYSAYLIIKQDL
jgi:hypothetical protein